jgi:ribosomal protein S18 acetylase RimI-like enzyme
VGKRLTEACIAQAKSDGSAQITLHSTEMMMPAVRMYEKMGFTRAPELDFQGGLGMLVMGFALPLR